MNSSHRHKILVVEDGLAYQEEYDDLLSEKYRLNIVGSKDEALNALVDQAFDAAIVDMRLKEETDNVDGLDVAAYIRAKTPDTPVILKSGFPTQTPEIESRIKALDLIVLDKSSDNQAQELLEKLAEVLSNM